MVASQTSIAFVNDDDRVSMERIEDFRCGSLSDVSPLMAKFADPYESPENSTKRPTADVHQRKRNRGGGKGTRTPDILLAKQALYQLSYTPTVQGEYTRRFRPGQPSPSPSHPSRRSNQLR